MQCEECKVIADNVEEIRPDGGAYKTLCPTCLNIWVEMHRNDVIIADRLEKVMR